MANAIWVAPRPAPLYIKRMHEHHRKYINDLRGTRVIRLQDIKINMEYVRKQIEGKVLHPYLLKYIDEPVIDQDKLLLLVSMLNEAELTQKQKNDYSVTAMLIQVALDTHEQVSNTQIAGEMQKNRQLTVLAGIYYSSLYYKILSESKDIGMIRLLSDGIKEVNEHKISVYQHETENVEGLMESVRLIESSLFSKIAERFNKPAWTELSSHLLLMKRLMEERGRYLDHGTSFLFERLKRLVFPKKEQELADLSAEQKRYLLLIANRYIDHSKDMIDKGMKAVPFLNSLLEERIHSILDQHQPMTKSIAEEG